MINFVATVKEVSADVEFSCAELIGMRKAWEAIDDFYTSVLASGGSTLISPTTGEVIEVEELQRVKGILSGLHDNTTWIIKE